MGDHESGDDDPPRANPSWQWRAGDAREPDKGKPGPRGDPRSAEAARDEWLQRDQAWRDKKQGTRAGGTQTGYGAKENTDKIGAAAL